MASVIIIQMKSLFKIRTLRKRIFDARLSKQSVSKSVKVKPQQRDWESVKAVYFFFGIILGITYLILFAIAMFMLSS